MSYFFIKLLKNIYVKQVVNFETQPLEINTAFRRGKECEINLFQLFQVYKLKM